MAEEQGGGAAAHHCQGCFIPLVHRSSCPLDASANHSAGGAVRRAPRAAGLRRCLPVSTKSCDGQQGPAADAAAGRQTRPMLALAFGREAEAAAHVGAPPEGALRAEALASRPQEPTPSAL